MTVCNNILFVASKQDRANNPKKIAGILKDR